MKRLLRVIIVVIFAVIFLVAAGIGLLVATFDVNQLRGDICRHLSRQLSADVTMDQLQFTFDPEKGLTLLVENFVVADQENHPLKNFLSIEKMSLGLDTMTLVSQRKIVVSSVSVTAPQVQIIRAKDGTVNVQKLSGPSTVGTSSASPPVSVPNSAAAFPLPELLVKSIKVEKGVVRFRDEVPELPMEIAVEEVAFDAQGLSFDKPFPVNLTARFFSPEDNIKIKGDARLNPKELQVRLEDVKVLFDFNKMAWDKFYAAIPASQNWGLTPYIKGQVRLVIASMIAGPQGVLQLSLDGSLVKFSVAFLETKRGMDEVRLKMQMTERDITVPEIFVSMGDGTASGTGKLEDYLGAQNYSGQFTVSDVKLGPVLPEFPHQIRLDGLLKGASSFSGAGLKPEQIRSNLKGDGGFVVADARLVNFNVLKFVLSRVAVMPELEETVESALSVETKKVIQRNDTIFNLFDVGLSLAGETATITKFDLVTYDLRLEAEGTVDLSQRCRIRPTIFVEPRLAQEIAGGVAPLAPLLEPEGSMKIPLAEYQGPLTGIKLLPDMDYLGRRILVTQGKKEIQKLITDAIGGPDDPSAPQDKTPEDAIIDGVLEKIFK